MPACVLSEDGRALSTFLGEIGGEIEEKRGHAEPSRTWDPEHRRKVGHA